MVKREINVPSDDKKKNNGAWHFLKCSCETNKAPPNSTKQTAALNRIVTPGNMAKTCVPGKIQPIIIVIPTATVTRLIGMMMLFFCDIAIEL